MKSLKAIYHWFIADDVCNNIPVAMGRIGITAFLVVLTILGSTGVI